MQLKLEKVISICADGASVMQGVHRGVVTSLKKLIIESRERKKREMRSADRMFDESHEGGGILGVHCVCHRFALVVSGAIKWGAIPKLLPDLLSDIYGYFSKSGHRKKYLKGFVDEVNSNRQGAKVDDPDEGLHRILKLEIERAKLPKKVVLTRWLSCIDCIKVLITGREAYVKYFTWECLPKGGRPVSEKALEIKDHITDNYTYAWFYFLSEAIPILTSMNVLFQSNLPLPHLLYDHVRGAQFQFNEVIGQEPRIDLVDEGEVTHTTPFGPALERYILACNSGGMQYGERGGHLSTAQVGELKHEMYLAVRFMLEQLEERFPEQDLRVYRFIRCVDPRNRRKPKLGKYTHTERVVRLMHFFEVPLFGFVSQEELLKSHKTYLARPSIQDLFHQFYERNGNGDLVNGEESIYLFYKALYLEGGETRDWAKFALFMLIVATGNAISERGFSAMAAVHSKSRSELGLPQVLASMLAAFNGPSYEDFFNAIERQGLAQGRQ